VELPEKTSLRVSTSWCFFKELGSFSHEFAAVTFFLRPTPYDNDCHTKSRQKLAGARQKIHQFKERIAMRITITANMHDDPGLAQYLDRCLNSVEKRTLIKAAVYATIQDLISYYDGDYRHLDIQLKLDPKPQLPA
jgi:hypothetical protein